MSDTPPTQLQRASWSGVARVTLAVVLGCVGFLALLVKRVPYYRRGPGVTFRLNGSSR